ncbi:MAG: polysaccharide biosynthesis protein, partial [Acidimicrobiales bacterium]|nr:polysaccharide biosynthesis protein [Acidimicrobiales bacterium]
IRDARGVEQIFKDRKPDIVFHAAALKHLTLLERHPLEAWKSNVIGTINVLNAAVASGVTGFVNISTDKAADASSILGFSKRIAERITASINIKGAVYVSVRFANVLGSRGSVLEVFRAQAEAGNPLTVTDANVTRFVMTIPEAVRLVTQAAAIGRPGEVLVLDMGRPIKILDIAKHYASRRNPPLDIIFTGLRPGEKLHEVLFGDGEPDDRPFHPKVSHVDVPPLSVESAKNAFISLLGGDGKDPEKDVDPVAIRKVLASICAIPSELAQNCENLGENSIQSGSDLTKVL